MKACFADLLEHLPERASRVITTWSKRQAKALASRKLYEPHQAERFRMGDMMALWTHWLTSKKRVRREAALYSLITFFTGARAIEVGNLFIEDIFFSTEGNALVMPVRQSKNNVFKDVPERLIVSLSGDCPIDIKSLFEEIRGARPQGRLFTACKNRRTLCYHYARGALELGWARAPLGHSGRRRQLPWRSPTVSPGRTWRLCSGGCPDRTCTGDTGPSIWNVAS